MSYSVTKDILFRGKILVYSLAVEGMTSYFLARLVGIDNHEDSRLLGNKSSALSFNQKADFLLDMKVLNGEARKKLQTFTEIRNQLMHNVRASTFEKCFSFLSGKDSWLLKNYPQQGINSKEKALENAVMSLAEDVVNIITAIVGPIREREEKEKVAPALRRRIEAINKATLEVESIVDMIIAERVKNKKSVDAESLKGIGKLASTLLTAKFELYWLEEINKVIDKNG